MNYSLYYQADITKELTWLLSATLKYCEHAAFDRAVDKKNHVFEFYVAPDLQDTFLNMMVKLEKEGVISNLQELHNPYQK